MTRRIVASTGAAAMLAVTMTAAQAPAQAPTQGNPLSPPSDRTTTPTARTQSDQQVTLTGCIMREGGSDFVLASAMPSGASGNVSGGVAGSTSAGPTGTSGVTAGAATGTSGTAPKKYRLSGERDLSGYVGQRVEIVGRTDPSASGGSSTGSSTLGTPGLTPRADAGAIDSTSDRPATGATSDTPRGTSGTSTPDSASSAPKGVAGQTAPMQHVTVTSVRTVDGSCQ